MLYTPSTGEKVVMACAARHLFAANRLRCPIFVFCKESSKEEWKTAFHSYTPLKVAVISSM